jgi:hypothetical protein
VLVAAVSTTLLLHCASKAAPTASSSAKVTGVDNALGLGLTFVPSTDLTTGTVQATLQTPLASDETLFIRVRQGKITTTSQDELDCSQLTESDPILSVTGSDPAGQVVYQGPQVDPSIVNLLSLYDDPAWATGDQSQAEQDLASNGPDPIVEACILDGSGAVRAKLQVNLAFAWDNGTAADEGDPLNASLDSQVHRLRTQDGTGGPITESNVTSQIEYGQLCVDQLGEIPFFKKIGPGNYETFDCRDFVGSNTGGAPAPIPGVESALIPVTVDGVVQTACTPGMELGPDSESYACMAKADRGMFLATGGVQPGPTVSTAVNDQGTHWILLCRKVADDGKGMTKSKRFNDMAMIGHNPATGRTCFFQNSIGAGKDGAHVPHPADVAKSTAVWSPTVQSYCSGTCHGQNAWVHSPWIDQARRSNGFAIVPKLGELPDYPISNPTAPYNIVAADKLGFALPQQLVSPEVGPCLNCHTLAGGTAGNFADWSTGTGAYFSSITATGAQFANSHWMPPRLDGLSANNWAQSDFGQAMTFLDNCSSNPSDPSCIWADTPRGNFNNPAVAIPASAGDGGATVTPAEDAGSGEDGGTATPADDAGSDGQ